MVDALSKKRDNLIYASYENPTETKSKDNNNSVIDIISNYVWNNETAATTSALSYTTSTNIPCCLAIEREQTVASSIMNIVRDANIVAQGYQTVMDNVKKIFSESESTNSSEESKNNGSINNESLTKIQNFSSKLGLEVLKRSKVDGASVETGILSPYNYLYATQMTGFKYAFPMLNEQDLYAISNTWTAGTDDNTSILLHNPIINMIHSGALAVARTVGADAPNILNLLDEEKRKTERSNRSSVFEMAKYFNFNTDDSDEIKISFVLFNTIVKNGIVDQWKRNLYFISLFNLRNLPFKLDYTSYLPPLLYDVIIPGVKRLPFCYVSSFSTTAHGLIRNMTIKNFLGVIGGADASKNADISVPIPEAWTVDITFKSMLGRSANLMLAGGADLPISITKNASYNDTDEQKKFEENINNMQTSQMQNDLSLSLSDVALNGGQTDENLLGNKEAAEAERQQQEEMQKRNEISKEIEKSTGQKTGSWAAETPSEKLQQNLDTIRKQQEEINAMSQQEREQKKKEAEAELQRMYLNDAYSQMYDYD